MALKGEVCSRDQQLAKKDALIGSLEKEIVQAGKARLAGKGKGSFFQRLRRAGSDHRNGVSSAASDVSH